MNANGLSPKPNARLNRIKKMSSLVKILFLFYFVVVGLVLALGYIKPPFQAGDQLFGSLKNVPPELKLYEALHYAIQLLGIIAFYRLLNLYEKGIIFSARNVSLIRQLGSYAIFYGVLWACLPVFSNHTITFPTLPLDILLSPWFIVGLLIVTVAWVMDEGRKIQEEQELTV